MGSVEQADSALAEAVERGRTARARASRSTFGDWQARADRPDPVEVLQASNATRLAELVPIRFGRMLQSPFAFLRGSAAVMAHDLAEVPTSGLRVQACGDCHLMNFGMFASPERKVVFGINDFDETLPGPWEWDLARLTASFVVAGLDVRLKVAEARATAALVVKSYRERMWEYAEMSPLSIWYDQIDAERAKAMAPDRVARRRREQLEAQARRRVADQLFPKLTTTEGGRLRIVDQPPLIFHPAGEGDMVEMALAFLAQYRESLAEDRRVLFDRYRFQDVAAKVVGVGSVGTRCLIALLATPDGHPLLLQVKEANPSVLEPFVGTDPVEHNGRRVVVGQRLMQSASDIFLGWSRGPAGRDFYVRQLRDMKLSVSLTRDPAAFAYYAGFCGWALARAHANSGDAAAIAGYLGRSARVDRAMADWAVAYAEQTDRDHVALVEAVQSGRIDAVEEY